MKFKSCPSSTKFTVTITKQCFPFFISVSPDTGEVAQADTADLIKIVVITCVALVSILIISRLVCIRLCRVSAKKKKERYDLNVLKLFFSV